MEDLEKKPEKISLRDVLFILFSKRHVLVGTMALVFMITMGLAFLADPVYETAGSVLVHPIMDPGLQVGRQLQTSATSLAAFKITQEDINSEISIMGSDEIMKQIVAELQLDQPEKPKKILSLVLFKLRDWLKDLLVASTLSVRVQPADQAVECLKKSLAIQPITMSNIIEVRMKGNDPSQITKIVNTLINKYIDKHIDVHKVPGGIEFFSSQAELYHKKLEQAEEALKQFLSQWSIIEIQSQRAANVELIKVLSENLSLVRGKVADQSQVLAEIDKDSSRENGLGAMTQELRGDTALVELTKALIPLLVEKERIGFLYPENSVEYKDALRQMQEMRQQYVDKQTQIINGMAVDLKGLQSQEESLVAEIERVQDESRFLTEKEVERDRLALNVEQYKKNYVLYQDKTEEARINEQKNSLRVANVSVSSLADEPYLPIFPRKLLMAVLALVVGAMMGTGSAFAAYYLDHTIKRPEEMARLCQAPVLSSLGTVEPKP